MARVVCMQVYMCVRHTHAHSSMAGKYQKDRWQHFNPSEIQLTSAIVHSIYTRGEERRQGKYLGRILHYIQPEHMTVIVNMLEITISIKS